MRKSRGFFGIEWSARRLSLWRLVPLLLCVLLPLPAFAQASSPPPPLVPAPSAPEAAPSESEEEDPYGGYDDDEPRDDEPRGELIPREWVSSGGAGRKGPRIIVESLSGLGLGFVGIAPGVFLGFALAASESSDDTTSDLLGVVALSFVGLTSGTALGVYAGGNLMGGEGRFLATFAGASLGALVGGLAAIPAAIVVDSGWIVPILAFPVAGAIIGYEMSHEQERERMAAGAGTRIELVPIMSVRPSGGLVAGLAGRF